MNKPVPYKGGIRVFFRRAEEAASFSREIGLQYVHAHIRYLEAMCKIGQATKAYEAIMQILPIGIEEQVHNAKTRQSNAYFSSSDADVKDRYEAEQLFEALRAGHVPVKGGWRIYSSGPGIFINQVISNFLGIRDYYEYIVLDPVLPKVLDGLHYTCEDGGTSVTYVFSIAHDQQAAVRSVSINGHEVPFVRQDNLYRQGGAMVARSVLQTLCNHQENTVCIGVV